MTLILIDSLNKFPEKLMITLLSFQLIITQISFVYFNYEIYIKKKQYIKKKKPNPNDVEKFDK